MKNIKDIQLNKTRLNEIKVVQNLKRFHNNIWIIYTIK